jgi:hypothetical protein
MLGHFPCLSHDAIGQAFASICNWNDLAASHGQPYGSSSQLRLQPKVLLSLGFHYYQKNFQKQLLAGDFALAKLPPKIAIFVLCEV